MNEVILVKKTDKLEDTFNEFVVKTDKSYMVMPTGVLQLNIPFDFQPINLALEPLIIWKSTSYLALQGVQVLSVEQSVDKTSLYIIVASTGSEIIAIPEDFPVVTGNVVKTIKVNAVDTDSSVINLA